MNLLPTITTAATVVTNQPGVALFAEAAAAGGPKAGMTVSMVVLFVIAAWVAVRTKGAQWPHIGLGILIGVTGANSFIGDIAWTVIGIIEQILNSVGAGFGGG